VVDRVGIAKVLIVDDHPMVREGLTMRLSAQPDLQVCGEAACEDEAIAVVKQTHPDLVLVDIALKSGDGIELVKQIKSRHPSIKMLVLSSYQESLYAERALRAGVTGYLSKQESHDKLLEAVRTVLAGKRYVSDETTQRLINRALGGSDDARASVDQLSDRELEIFRMIGEGLTSGVIAERLFLSTHTIDTHRENMKRKLGVKNASELNRAAVRWVLQNS
jgi:DNA-binding NarL/FixJ family response regulator